MQADLHWVTTEKERADVYRLRYEIYVEGQGLFQDEADHERRLLTDEHDADAHIAVAKIDGRLVGTVRLDWGGDVPFSSATREAYDVSRFAGVVDESDVVLVSRLVVRPELRGATLGFDLFLKVFEFAAEHGAELILGSCESHLLSHYRKLGFRPFGELYNHPTNGVLVPIAAVMADFEHLRRIDSPSLRVARRRTKPVRRLEEIVARVTDKPAIVSQELEDTEKYWGEVSRCLADSDGEPRGILGELSRPEAAVLLAKSHLLTCNGGDALTLKGHVSRTLYILLSGNLDIYDDGAHVARVSERGSILGEVAALSKAPRISDLVAGPGGARVLALSDSNLRKILASHDALAAKFLLFVARRLCQKLIDRSRVNESRARRPAFEQPSPTTPSPWNHAQPWAASPRLAENIQPAA